MHATTLAQIRAEACIPEQLPHYVQAVSGRRAVACLGYAAYLHEGHAVLAAYPGSSRVQSFEVPPLSGRPPSENELLGGVSPAPLADALEELRALGCASVTTLSPFAPLEAPAEAAKAAIKDLYWQISLPAPRPNAKLRNMLARSGKEVQLHEEGWAKEHEALVEHYLRSRPFPQGVRAVFSALGSYVSPRGEPGGGQPLLLAARRKDASLAAFAVGDFSGLETAFYMFAFRWPDAPPGTADLLLAGLARHGEAMGHSRMNLGLGINPGISHFKKKWGASPYLPYVETAWNLPRKREQGTGVKAWLRGLFE